MSCSKIVRIVLGSIVACLASVALATPSAESHANRPEGSWLLEVNFPPQFSNPPLSFKELVTIHAGGTLTETNSTLNAASGVLGFPIGFGLVGSDGQGTWRRTQSGQIEMVFRKMAFCGTAAVGLCTQFGKSPGDFLGYLVVRMNAVVKGDAFESTQSDTNLVIGTTPDSSVVIPFGAATATGTRLP